MTQASDHNLHRHAHADAVGAIGIVVIGRNEGERLKRCLRSVLNDAAWIIYVDSGSTDGSREFASSLGRVEVIDLDMSKPFTMARSRNTGFARLRERVPDVQFVQFVDGDCEVLPGWLQAARQFLVEHPEVAVVAGRCRERFPEATIYNHLADLEWQAPAGEARACGGNAMYRAEVFAASQGFREGLIAGEEPELCLRLRRDGWKVWRLADDMVLHDVAMQRFGQWWRRAVRGGHAYAESAWLHGRGPERYRVREVISALLWGLLAPLTLVLGLALAFFVHGGFALLALAAATLHAVLAWRIARNRRQLGDDPRSARRYTLFCLLGKPAQVQGIATFVSRTLRRATPTLIEYKTAQPAGPLASPSAPAQGGKPSPNDPIETTERNASSPAAGVSTSNSSPGRRSTDPDHKGRETDAASQPVSSRP